MTIAEIQRIVAEHFGISKLDLISQRRNAKITKPRQLAYFLVREHTGASYPEIGRAFGDRDHTTIMHGCKRAVAMITRGELATSYARIQLRLLDAMKPPST